MRAGMSRPAADARPAERRTALRRPAGRQVLLLHHGRPIAFATALDASARGVLVSPLPAFRDPPPVGCRLELGFGLERDGITRNYRIPVRVAHHGRTGIGLAFEAGPHEPAVAVVLEATRA